MEQVLFEVGKVYEAVGGGYFVKVQERLPFNRIAFQLLDRDGGFPFGTGGFAVRAVNSAGEESFSETVRFNSDSVSLRVYASDEADMDKILANAQRRKQEHEAQVVSKVCECLAGLEGIGVTASQAADVYDLLSSYSVEVLNRVFSSEVNNERR